MFPDYVRLAANVSDHLFVERVQAIASVTPLTDQNAVDYVNNLDNSNNVFDMFDIETGETIAPEQNRVQSHVCAYVTRDTSGQPINSANTYNTYIVPQNRGGYRAVISQ